MLVFSISAVLLTALALAFVLVPLLRRRDGAGPSVREANVAALRSQRIELENDVAMGMLPKDARDEALAELVTRANDDLNDTAEAPAAPERRSWPAAVAFALLIPAGAFGVYAWVGSPGALDPRAVAAAQAPFDDPQMEAMVEQLAKKVRERPDDAQGWTLLARSYQAMGRHADALEAYKQLIAIAPNDPSALADYADALALSRGRNLAGEPTQLVLRALQIDPRHAKALALAGTATLNAGQFAESIAYWERLYLVVPPGSQDQKEIRDIVEDVRGRAAAAGKPQPPSKVLAAAVPMAPAPKAPPLAPGTPATLPPSHPPVGQPPATSPPGAMAAAPKAKSASGKGISGSVRLAEPFAGRTSPTDTLFIYARAETGSRMPLAILRGGAGQLPKEFLLDDSMGMTPTAKLSEAASVVVEARISKAGSAMAQPGDLLGTSKPVAPGATGVAIVIDRVQP